MEPENGNTEPPDTVDYLRVYKYLKRYVSEQSKKRQLPKSDIVNECIQFHMENAGT